MNPFNTGQTAGDFFAGRERQLKKLRELLEGLSKGLSSNMCIVGRGGEGKTSFLEQVVKEARAINFVACKCVLDIQKSAEGDIHGIVEELLGAIDEATGEARKADWKLKDKSTYLTPRRNDISAGDLGRDFDTILRFVRGTKKYTACVICIDEGHRISPIALAALKNALQGGAGSGYYDYPFASKSLGDNQQ